MTNVLDPAETRVINPETEQTAVIRRDHEESTHILRHRRALPPTQLLRRSDAHPDQACETGEVPLLGPTGAERAVADRLALIPPLPGEPTPPTSPTPPPPVPIPGPPAWPHEQSGWYPAVAANERVADPTEVVSLLGALGGAKEPQLRRSQPYRKPEGWVRVKRHRAPALWWRRVPWWTWLAIGSGGTVALEAVAVYASVLAGVQW